MIESSGIPTKLLESHLFVRLGNDGQPQVLRVEPFFTDQGPNLAYVVIFEDEGEPSIMTREFADQLLTSTGCVPLEVMTQWKHKIKH